MLRIILFSLLIFSGSWAQDSTVSNPLSELEVLGDKLFSEGVYEEAIEQYTEALEENEKSEGDHVLIAFARLQTKIGKCHYYNEDPMTAQLYFEWALDVYTHHKTAEKFSLEIARLYALSGLIQPALDWLKAAIKSDHTIIAAISRDADFNKVQSLKAYQEFVLKTNESHKSNLSSTD